MPQTKEIVSLRRQERRDALRAYKLSLGGCVDCGSLDGLHFDHRDDEVKLFNPADVSTRSWTVLFDEWAKCDVRCAACHTKRHQPRRPLLGRKCSVLLCNRPHRAKGYCAAHYWHTYGKQVAS